MTSLTDFLRRKSESQARQERIAQWHIEAHVNGGCPLPYSHEESWVNVNQYDDEYKLDTEKTLDVLATVLAYATSVGATIEKNYRSDFELLITVGEDGNALTVRYYGDREAVCTKRVTGTKHVPEKITPAHDEDIIEWDCEPVSLLARAKTLKSESAA